MRYYLIAGEASGDLHGSNLIRELKLLDHHAEIRAWGGDLMQASGATIVKHIRDLAFMGFAEVIKNLPTIFKNFRLCKTDILAYQPDVIIFIDYPGFNLRMAEWAKKNGFKTIFYISPQIWAWKENRVKAIRKFVDKMLVILPFEEAFYQKRDYKVTYVGHPLVSVIEKYKTDHAHLQKNEHLIALLPGSRKQEIKTKLPVMLAATENFPEFTFSIAKAPAIEPEFYQTFLEKYPNVKISAERTYSLLMQARAALVTSGTATLETALFGVPEIICYKAGSISYEIGKRLIQLKFICLVNLIMNKEVVKELIQHELTPKNITQELKKLLFDAEKQEQIQKDYAELKTILSKGGNASQNAARLIFQFTSENN